MYKNALAALALALSFGLNTTAFAQSDGGQNQSQQGDQKTDQQKTDQQKADGSKTDQTTGDDKKPATTATTTKPAATPAPTTPAVYVQNYGWTKTGRPIQQPSLNPAPATGSAPANGAGGKLAAAQGTTVTTKTAAASKKDELVVIQQSPDKMYNSKIATKWQTFNSYITLKPGQDALPLTMTVTNGGYKQIAMFLSGQKLASDKDFKGSTLTMQMTGALVAGDNQLRIDCLGPTNATLSWKLTTKKPVITAITPGEGPIESEVKISGRNFAKQASANRIVFGKLSADASRFVGKDLVFKVPTNAPGGKTPVSVEIGGIASKPIDFLVKFAPEVTNVDCIAAPPGQSITLTGKGFSPVKGDNQVIVGGVQATVQAESATSITFTMPQLEYPTWGTVIQVKSAGVESKKNGSINIQMRVIPNDGVPQQ